MFCGGANVVLGVVATSLDVVMAAVGILPGVLRRQKTGLLVPQRTKPELSWLLWQSRNLNGHRSAAGK